MSNDYREKRFPMMPIQQIKGHWSFIQPNETMAMHQFPFKLNFGGFVPNFSQNQNMHLLPNFYFSQNPFYYQFQAFPSYIIAPLQEIIVPKSSEVIKPVVDNTDDSQKSTKIKEQNALALTNKSFHKKQKLLIQKKRDLRRLTILPRLRARKNYSCSRLKKKIISKKKDKLKLKTKSSKNLFGKNTIQMQKIKIARLREKEAVILIGQQFQAKLPQLLSHNDNFINWKQNLRQSLASRRLI